MNHIKHEEALAWCQTTIPANEFHFKDIEQAIINNLHGQRLICPYCVRKIVNDLLTIPPHLKLTEEVPYDPT